ncbi:MAG: cytochrome c [Pseudomonadota bacterium]
MKIAAHATIPAIALLSATAVLAHDGVKNPAVMDRMRAMERIGQNTQILGDMARGRTTFDAATAQQAAQTIAVEAADIPDLFKAEETDPKSEALPAIWEDFGAFSSIAAQLSSAASQAAANITSEQDLQAAMRNIGATCGSCHKTYRVKK